MRLRCAIMSRPMPPKPRVAAMSPDEFRDILSDRKLDQGKAADLLGVSRRTVSRWATGRTPIDRHVAASIRKLPRKKQRTDGFFPKTALAT